MIFFKENDEVVERATITYSEARMSEVLNLILQAKRKIKQNVQPTLVMEQLILQIQR